MIINQIKMPISYDMSMLKAQICKSLQISEAEITSFRIAKSSIDARKKPNLIRVFSVEIGLSNEAKVFARAKKNKKISANILPGFFPKYEYPAKLTKSFEFRPVVVGMGPAGLFCGLLLAKAGLKPILIDRGMDVDKRFEAVSSYWNGASLHKDTNVSFGEGGAGTFSDGKLGTLIKDKDGKNRAVLEAFVSYGAKEEILFDYKPHIGTDVLINVVKAMREDIVRLGGEVFFETKLKDLLLDHQGSVAGILLEDGREIATKIVVLAIGHSARDTFLNLYNRGVSMEAKSFAVGLRVEHSQKLINRSQYGVDCVPELGSAPYKVATRTSQGRNVFSFCMCPGGYVVDASSEEGRIAVNGMSYSMRDGQNANSAIIVNVDPSDYGSSHPLAGIEFQRSLEEKAYQVGNGKVPRQRFGIFEELVENHLRQEEYLTDKGFYLTEDGFISRIDGDLSSRALAWNSLSEDPVTPCEKGCFVWGDVSQILPDECNRAFVEGMHHFGKQIQGFDRKDTILSGVESRTSSPVRITRDEELQANFKGLYPCGEGAGYAGGITSAAMDGLRVGEEIVKYLASLT